MERCLTGVLSLGEVVSELESAIMSEVTLPSTPVTPVTVFMPAEYGARTSIHSLFGGAGGADIGWEGWG